MEMSENEEREFEKRVDDIRAIRAMLAESSDMPLVYPWAFFAWALLAAAGTVAHYLLYTRNGLDVRNALVLIWLPILVLGAVAESVSFALKAGKTSVLLLNRRFGGALLGAFATIIILTVVAIRLCLTGAMTPGLRVLMASFPIIFYVQLSYSSLFIEALLGLSVGLLLEFAGANDPSHFLAGGLFMSLFYAAGGFHILSIERRWRG